MVEEALKILIAENPLFVRYIYTTRDNKTLDAHKIDFLIHLANFLALPLQVKTSDKAMKEHKKKAPHILAVHIKKRHNAETVSRIIERLVKILLANPKRIRIAKHTFK